MLKMFLASHGKMATGVKSSADILFGNSTNLYCYDAYIDGTSINDELEKFFDNVNDMDQVLLLSDLYGGSVNTAMVSYASRENVYLIAGFNLALVLELMARTEIVSEQELESIIHNSRQMMKIVSVDCDEEETEEQFF